MLRCAFGLFVIKLTVEKVVKKEEVVLLKEIVTSGKNGKITARNL